MRQRTDDYVITDNTVPRREVKSPEKETPVKRFPNPVSYTPTPKPFTSTPVNMDYGEKFARPSRPGVAVHHLQPPKTTQTPSKPLPGPPSKGFALSNPSVNRGSSRLSMMTPMPEYEPTVSDRMSLEPVLLTRRGSADSFEQESPTSTPIQPSVSQSVKQQPSYAKPTVQQQVALPNAWQQVQKPVQQTVRQQTQPFSQPQQIQRSVQQPIQQPVRQQTQPRPQSQQIQQPAQQTTQLQPEVSIAVVLYDFKYPSEKCITSKKGEQLLVYISKSPENWYFAKNSIGEYGIIPRTYCKLLP